MSVHEVFQMTQEIERELGKVAKPKTASRPFDIDILFYGDHHFQDPHLTIPHPRWKERLFVLVPLHDLVEEIILQNPDERYLLKECIKQMNFSKWSNDSLQMISLLEKNADLQ